MMAGMTRGRIVMTLLLAVVAVLSLSVGGCGQGDTDVHHDDAIDPHAGHDHGDEAEEVDPHAGHDHGDEAEEVDPHAGHDHGDEAEEADGHEGDDHSDEAGEVDGHEGDDHGDEAEETDGHEGDDHGDEAEEVDPHAGHDHGDETGLTLSERDTKDAGIEFAVAGPGPVETHTRLLGEVRVNEERLAHVVPTASGTIREVRVRAGDDVTAGQVLALLASRELAEARAAYLGARGRRELAQIEHDREKELWERNILAEQDYLDAKQALLEADIELQAAEQTLHALGTSDQELDLLEESHDAGAMTRMELRAPISGTVTDLHMVLGEMVGEDSEVLVVADLSTVWVEFDVPQTELHSVREGIELTISSTGMNVADETGIISFMSPVVDAVTRTVLARVELPNKYGQWRPGLFVTATMTSGQSDAPVVVPTDAVQLLDGEHVVFVPEGDGFEAVLVSIGRTNGTHSEILSGLEHGQRYVAEGAFALKAEMVTSGMDSHAGHGH